MSDEQLIRILAERQRPKKENEIGPAEPIAADMPALVDNIAAFIGRFVFLRNEAIYLLIALWIMGTHVYEDFDFFGYLFLHSPEPATGKSRLLEVLDLLVFRSSGLQVSPTEAVLFRTGSCTQLLDEVDTWADREVQLRAVLNAGFKKGGFVTRVEKSAEGELTPKRHHVYCPRALAGIGPTILSPATRDRTFMVKMERRTKDERGERFRAGKVGPEAQALRQSIEKWTKAHRQEIREQYDNETFPYLERLSERTMDIASPLAAILEVAFSGSAQLEEAQQIFYESLIATRNEVKEVDDGPIFKELLRLAEEAENDPLVGNSTELAQMCGLEQTQAGRITNALRRHGFEPKSIRKDGANPLKRYELHKQELQDIMERYGKTGDHDDSTSPNQVM
jgi:hypothetical protein